MKKFTLPFTFRTLVSYALLLYVCGAAHEMAHHFTGAIVCQQFGRMTFNLFVTSDSCTGTVAPQAAGPLLSYILGWIGALLLLAGRKQLLGFGLIAATLPYMRMLSAWTGGGDESVIARQLLGPGNHKLLVGSIVTAIVLPPLVIAYQALANARRPLVYFLAILIPFVPAIVLQRVDQRYLVGWINAPETFAHPTMWGIPVAVLVTHIVVFLLFALVAARYLWEPVDKPMQILRSARNDNLAIRDVARDSSLRSE
jgi:hypothetical protein